MIPDSKVEEVRAAADIVAVIGELVPLTRAGKEYKARCPFHDERTPSFFVVPDKGIFKCFGCGRSGDVFGFLMQHGGLDFPGAVKHVARVSGIEVIERRRHDPREEMNRIYWELNGFARDWFRDRLASDEGARARAYLESRGIGGEVSERFGLGLAPGGGQRLRQAAAAHEYADDLLVRSGLVGESSDGGEPYDRFRDRVIFPIEVFGGRTAAFGGRILPGAGTKAAKYLNSPETPIFRKSEVLYALAGSRNAIRRREATLLVEGYMDVVSLAAHGFDNVVAPLGTSLTEEQARAIRRYARQVVILFDSDSAGLRASFRAADTLLAAGAHPLLATLPEGEDPDSAVRARGRGFLDECVGDAVDVLDRKLHILQERGFLESIDGRRTAVDRLLPTLRAVSAGDAALRDVYFSQAAERTGVRRTTLEAEVEASAPSPPRAEPRPPERVGDEAIRGDGVETTLLLIMARRPDLADEIAEKLSASDLSESHRAAFRTLLEDPEAPPDALGPRTRALLRRIADDPREFEGEDAACRALLDDCVTGVRAAALDRRLSELDAEIRSAGEEEQIRLFQEKDSLTRERRALAPQDWRRSVRSLINTSRT